MTEETGEGAWDARTEETGDGGRNALAPSVVANHAYCVLGVGSLPREAPRCYWWVAEEGTVDNECRPVVAAPFAVPDAIALRHGRDCVSEIPAKEWGVTSLGFVFSVPKAESRENEEVIVTRATKDELVGAGAARIAATVVGCGLSEDAAAVDCAAICGIRERPS